MGYYVGSWGYDVITFKPLRTQEEWDAFNEHLPILHVEDSGGILALRDGELVGGCVTDNWTETSVQCHFYIKDWTVLRHDFLETCFEYMFNTCNRRIIYGLVPGDNAKAIKFNSHMGFTEKCRFEGAFKDGVDYVIMELKKENCKHLLAEEAA